MNTTDIIEYLSIEGIRHTCRARQSIEIKTFCSLFNLKNNAITWVRYIDDVDPNTFKDINDVILFADINDEKDLDIDVIYVENVHATFFQVLEHFFQNENPNVIEPTIERTAIVLSDQIGNNVYIGHNTFIDKDVVIGDNVTIFHNVVIRGKVVIGDNCLIESLTAIGVTGYGHYTDINGKVKTAPHLGGVVIGDNVEIGSHTSVERGCLDNTVIEDSVMIDSMSQIGHNAIIKKGAMLIAAHIGGSATVGEKVWVGFGSIVSDQTVVGDNSYIGASTFINKDVPESKIMVGVPARVLRDKTEEPKIKRKSKR